MKKQRVCLKPVLNQWPVARIQQLWDRFSTQDSWRFGEYDTLRLHNLCGTQWLEIIIPTHAEAVFPCSQTVWRAKTAWHKQQESNSRIINHIYK